MSGILNSTNENLNSIPNGTMVYASCYSSYTYLTVLGIVGEGLANDAHNYNITV